MGHSKFVATEIQASPNAAECSRLRKVISRLAVNALHSQRAASDLELAFGEAFSNVVKYGEQNSKVSVRVESPSRSELALEMAYSGKEFDTCVTYPCEPHSGEGGFGRFIMQQLTDGMEYSFRDDLTILKLIKRR